MMEAKWLIYTFLGVVADVLDVVLTLIAPDRQRSISSSDIDDLSNEEILELGKNAPKLHPKYSVHRLTPTTVAKPSQDMRRDPVDATEANALKLVFEKTTIPVPRVRRVVKARFHFWIVMDYIPGLTLAQLWPTLSAWRKIYFAFMLRRYIRQLRRFTASTTVLPGPLSKQAPLACGSPVFGNVRPLRGPFRSYSELSAFFNKRQEMTAQMGMMPKDDFWKNEFFDDSGPLVLTHQDINLRNIILGEDGRLWMVDWSWAGYFPPWFEYVTARIQNEDDGVSGTKDKFWRMLIPFICGPYFRQEQWLDRMSPSLHFR